jgi:hypothetical protein
MFLSLFLGVKMEGCDTLLRGSDLFVQVCDVLGILLECWAGVVALAKDSEKFAIALRCLG